MRQLSHKRAAQPVKQPVKQQAKQQIKQNLTTSNSMRLAVSKALILSQLALDFEKKIGPAQLEELFLR